MASSTSHSDLNAPEIPTGYELDGDGNLVAVPECGHVYSGHKPHVPLGESQWLWPTFFETYARTGRLGAACAAVGGVSVATVKSLIMQSLEFRQGLNEAREAYVGALHAELQRRALHGVTRGVYYKGELVSTYQEKDTKALELLLKHASAEWRLLIDGPRAQGSTTVNVNSSSVTNILATSPDALEQAQAALDPRTMSQGERDALRALMAARRATAHAGQLPPGDGAQASAGRDPGAIGQTNRPMLEVEATERHAATEPAGVAPEASNPLQDGRKP